MELKTLDVQVVSKEGSIQFNNFESIKTTVSGYLEQYKGLTLNDDNKQEIKSIRAELNKASKALDDERKVIKKSYMKPLELFEEQVKDLTSTIKEVVGELDTQVKQAEELEREEKKSFLVEHFNALVKDNPKLDFINFDDVGLNITLSASDKKLKEEINAYLEQVATDLLEIETDANAQRLLAKYRLSKNLQQSRIQLNLELQQEKQVEVKQVEVGHAKPEPQVLDQVEEVLEITFTVTALKSKLIALREYMKANGISYE